LLRWLRNANDTGNSAMRAVLLILIIIIVAAIIALATGLLDINTVRGVRAPDISTTGNGVSARGGQAPAFEVETGSVTLGTQKATVPVPSVNVNPANGQPAQPNAAQQAAPAQPARPAQSNVVSGNSTQ
jgi:predicted small secreted protein